MCYNQFQKEIIVYNVVGVVEHCTICTYIPPSMETPREIGGKSGAVELHKIQQENAL